MSTSPSLSCPSQMPGVRIGAQPAPRCSDLYEKFDLLTASEIVIDGYVGQALSGDFGQVSHQDLGHACMNLLMLCHETPMEHCELVSTLLAASATLQDCLPGVLALRGFAQQSLILVEHDAASALAH